ncbi:MAG: DNA cytosine methyltransferase [Candidatus Aminicenantes bacterium]|nr:DNA cytosine methyltransferase [Candidatus Aminicenantes bacterium]
MKKKEKSLGKLKAVDFFCGAGGITYGFSLAGIKVLAGIDIDAECKETYELNNPHSEFIHVDINKLKAPAFRKRIGIEKNDESLVFIGCSPCQYWTRINTQKAKSTETKNLLKEFRRFVDYFKPGFIVIENVPGLSKRKKESKLEDFLVYLEENEYAYTHGIINANDYGVPQKRKRFILIASRVLKSINLPEPQKNPSLVVKNFIGVWNGFPKIEAGHKDDSSFQHTAAMLSEKNILRLNKTSPDGGNRWSWKDDPYLQINAYKGKDHIFRDVYGRMYWNKPAPTITTKFIRTSNGRFSHPEEHRGLSLREGAVLQTFPKNYVFRGSNIDSIAKQIGNAVPPELSRRIGETLVKEFKDAYI